MKFKIDHDYHIHSFLSSCSKDENQTTENILKYAEKNNLEKICITDHFWSSQVSGARDWYVPQNYQHVSKSLPLPQGENVKFYFGCETDMDKYFRIGISQEDMEKFDFIIIPTTHLHMDGFTIDPKDFSIERRAELYVERFARLLEYDLPFKKIGIAHLTCPLIAPESFGDHIKVLEKVDDKTFFELFTKSAEKGMGIELNFGVKRYDPESLEKLLRPYKIAKKVGCKFYLGSDAHRVVSFDNVMARFEKIVELLDLKETDKFSPFIK